MKKIAIIGGGIAGLSVANLLMDKCQIDIYTDNLGGEYLSGGLKYLHHTNGVEHFIKDVYYIQGYDIRKVIGSVYRGGKTYLHPEYFWINPHSAKSMQQEYWDKTRGTTGALNSSCMNDPWQYKENLKIDFRFGLKDLVEHLVFRVTRNCNLNLGVLFNIDSILEAGYDKIIYTIPIDLLMKYFKIKVKSKQYKKLKVLRFKVDPINKIWWDYLYVVDRDIPFHRISRVANIFDIESTQSKFNKVASIEFLKQFGIKKFNEVKRGVVSIKGHLISSDGVLELIKDTNVVLLGRYAQMNSRMTWDKVIEESYKIRKDIVDG